MISVLIVDDDFMVARIHERFVERTEGFHVAGSVRTGAEALSMVADLAPDLVLLDVHLPDMSGLDVLATLRSVGSTAGVVMVTAERSVDAVRTALHGGAMQYLVKPFEYDDLATRLRQVAAALGRLGSGSGEADQDVIDQVFGTRAAVAAGTPLPKGLSPETAELVLNALRGRDELSAAEAADLVGMSRVSARRYLEYFVNAGDAEVRLQYGSAGRPERRYRSTATT